ncbi:MAG TPA: DEAD/DEAH box helicase [Candidatus Paceibacterota bacterium]|nr:DEAD/DEAH box helicase [Candidatus Paceibacterota bacterium]
MTPIKTLEAAEHAVSPSVKFTDLSLSDSLLGALNKHDFVTPTPIQSRVIPLGIEGKDIIGIAQTGTGKTLGFGIPMIERIIADKNARGLVLLPTRELALQVDETIRKVGTGLGIYTAVLIGGDSMGRQIRDLRAGPNIVIATPGRLIDHLEQKTISLDRVSMLVLDEADHMFDIGFMPQIKEIVKKVPKTRQTMLFSATMPEPIAKLAMEHMQLPLRIEVAPAGTANKNVEQEIVVVERKAKFGLLSKLVGEHQGQPVLVFTRTKHGAKEIARSLRDSGMTAAEIHSNRTLGQRREALDGFKKHKYQVLVATDIAARGIDVKDVALVVNYDLPEQSEDYVHRIGRTGRAGKEGKAVSFATPDQKRDIMDIERLIKKEIPRKSHEGAAMSESSFSGGSRGYGSRGGRGFGRGGFRGSRGGFRGGPRSFGGPRGGHSSHSAHGHSHGHAGHTVGSHGGASRGPRRGFNSKYPRPLKTDPSKKVELGTGYRRVFRKGVR